jgi:hypothetical protein
MLDLGASGVRQCIFPLPLKDEFEATLESSFHAPGARPSHSVQKISIIDCMLLHREEVSVLHCGCSF